MGPNETQLENYVISCHVSVLLKFELHLDRNMSVVKHTCAAQHLQTKSYKSNLEYSSWV